KQKLSQAIEKFNSTPLTFTLTSPSENPDQPTTQNIEIPLTDLQINLSADQTFTNLPKFDFNNSNFTTLIASSVSEKTLNPAYQYDLDLLQKSLEEKLALTTQRASNASFFFDEKKNIQVKPEQIGKVIDREKLQKDLESHLNNLDSSTIELSLIEELPEVNSAELEAYRSDLLVKIESPLTLKHANQSWTLNLKDHLNGLDYKKVEGQIMLAINDQFFDEYFQNEIFSKIEVPVSNVKIFYDDQGQIQFEGRASHGISVKKEDFRKLLEASINTLDTEIQIPTEESKGSVEAPADLQEKGIKDLVSVGHTAFAGSTPNRRHNIQTAMDRYQAQLIAPGQTYSFNERLGEVDGSTGYKLELVIKSTGTVPEFGGGVCQVSSTVYKAALLSGLTIDERSPHSYAVGYYAQVDGYGLDATIYPGVKDLIFTNNTPGHILIQTVVEGDHAYVNFYGTSDGRQVRLANYWKGNNRGTGGTQLIPTKTLPPGVRKQVERANVGFDASWDRIIVDKDGVETTENIYSVYRATANKILVGEE
ncbi:MAG: VanW family protein, partial [Candidatus Altimarinota bacterium]